MNRRSYVDFDLGKVHCITGKSLSYVGLALTAASGVAKYAATNRAAGDVEEASRRNADAIRAETTEQVRRDEKANKSKMSLARAQAGASGGRINYGSTQNYLSEMKKTFNAEVDWLKKSGGTRAQNEILRGEGAGAGLRGNAMAGAFGSAGRFLSAFK